MKHNLEGGYCAVRFKCKNINKECCNDTPKPNEDFVECNYLEEKTMEEVYKEEKLSPMYVLGGIVVISIFIMIYMLSKIR